MALVPPNIYGNTYICGWDDDFISRGIKCTLYKVIVQFTLLYASETWALPKQQLHRLEVFQMKSLGIP